MLKKIIVRNHIFFLINTFLISFILLIIIFNINVIVNALDADNEFKSSNIKENLVLLYCDSLNKDIFNGLENESILKYEYFFSSMPNEKIDEPKKFVSEFKSKVKETCLYELNEFDEKELFSFLIKLKSNN